MAKAADQFRPTDVTLWGIVALVCWGVAVLSANLSGLLPPSLLAGLHASRLEGSTINQLRAEMIDLRREAQQIRRENNLLAQRFNRAEEASGDVTRRVGALESSLPRIIERQTTGRPLDPAMTGSITEGQVLNFDADGGSVSVQQRPLPLPGMQPMVNTLEAPQDPAPSLADPDAFGLALGFPVAPDDAEAQWQSLNARVGTLLIGLAPLLAPVEGSSEQRLVVGPVQSKPEAIELCSRMDRVGIPCETVPFTGDALPLLN